MRAFFFVLLLAVSGLHLVTAFECYVGQYNVSGTETNCSSSSGRIFDQCCVKGKTVVGGVQWKQKCKDFDQTEVCKWYPPYKEEICCCDEPLCNDVNSLVWKMAVNRQECHVGNKSSSCGQTVPAPESIRCEQDEFGCSVTVEGEGSAVNIKYECVEKCDQQKPCPKESNGYKCCCVGNKCNDEHFAKTTLDTFCPTTTTPGTTSTTATSSPSFPTYYAIILIVFVI